MYSILKSVGYFDSKLKFPGIEITKKRVATCYEIELFLEDGTESYLDGEPYIREKYKVMCVRPGTERYSHLHFSAFYLRLSLPEAESEKTEETERIRRVLDSLPRYMSVENPLEYISVYQNLIRLDLEPSTIEVSERGRFVEGEFVPNLNPAEGDVFLLESELYKFLCLLVRDTSRHERRKQASDKRHFRIVSDALKFIDENFSEPICLESISAAVYLSPAYFQRIFTEIMRKSPSRYLVEKRVSHARLLLTSSNIPMTEIAQKCGFSSQSYFNYVFKREVGVCPGKYRAESQNYY